ncbi:hypothetical protein [Lentzea nigeriaca]|uniref:hypothetical protein n=1 Tax=Lentzea nigeriaca TaxID=1128665 RepID=UPI00195CC31F|nr:hypothetical protein [Lentzea nigeriaca]MBM7857972.1 hypothetical protein [Lentzea nigeriaca]
MEFLLTLLLQPHVVVFIAIVVVFYALLPERRARARAKAIAEQSPAMSELAADLGGTLSGPDKAEHQDGSGGQGRGRDVGPGAAEDRSAQALRFGREGAELGR